jgi:deferrochelatase/peroxidase EfeB
VRRKLSAHEPHCHLTICAPLPTDRRWRHVREGEIEDMIDALGNPASKALSEALNKTGCIHFVSLNLIRSTEPREPSYLLLEASADGRDDNVIAAILASIGAVIFPIFQRACNVDRLENLDTFLRRHRCRLSQTMIPHVRRMIESCFGGALAKTVIGLPFAGLPGMTVARIRAEQGKVQVARSAIDAVGPGDAPLAYLEAAREATGAAALRGSGYAAQDADESDLTFVDHEDAPWLKERTGGNIFTYLRLVPGLSPVIIVFLALVWAGILYAWSFPAIPGAHANSWADVAWYVFDAVMAFSVSLPIVAVLLAVIGGMGYRALRKSEERNHPKDLDPDPAVVREMMLRENACEAHNHMVSITQVVRERFRLQFTLPFAMRIIRSSIEQKAFREGFLADIGTIHFARWLVLPNTNNLVFLSNYNGSWESYLEDFITKASMGLTGIWSNCEGFPRTKRLFWKGAVDGDRFKRWARRSMTPTRFWYSAYPELTAQQIRTNALICDGMRKISTASDAEAWLELFGSIPRPDFALETEEIQGLVFGAWRELLESRCIVIQFGEGDGRSWLEDLLKRNVLSFGDKRPAGNAACLAFSASGLAKLGLADEAQLAPEARPEGTHPASVTNFPAAFVLGMHSATRQRVLGDLDSKGEPYALNWGGQDNQADAVLLIYGLPDDKLQDAQRQKGCIAIGAFEKQELQRLDRFRLQHPVLMSTSLPPQAKNPPEPFGYADGISQPVIRALDFGTPRANPIHVVEAGEFVLGYKDNRGYFPPTPQVPAHKDPGNYLPGPPADLPKRWPEFQSRYATRDFGRNGSFLVIRQLEQDVEGFNDWLLRLSKDEGVSADMIAAKLMGRWKDGPSVVKYAYEGDTRSGDLDNDFRYGADDPQGYRCPFGAHIRRANPRDSMNPRNKHEIGIVNRHRILRRGRPYQEVVEGKPKQGLLFMCLNADIERQFEFVQQNWINSPSHHGLLNERDPVAAHGDAPFFFSMPNANGPGKRHVRPPGLVKLRGGGYFFLPSKSALDYLAAGAGAALAVAAQHAPPTSAVDTPSAGLDRPVVSAAPGA